MTYILLFLVYGSSLSSTEFRSKAACDQAGQALEAKLKPSWGASPAIAWVCVPKDAD